MFKVTIAGLWAHKLRLALTTFIIILGVAFACATLILSNALQTTFDSIFTTQGTHVAVVVRGHTEPGGSNGGFADAHRPVPSSLIDSVRAVSGVSTAEGVIFRAGASPLNPAGRPYASSQGGPPEFATNWIQSAALSPYHLRSGSAPVSANDVVIDAGTARLHGIVAGQHIDYVINGGPKQEFVVSGIAGYGNADSLAGATISLFTLDTTQRILDLQGKFDQIDVAANQGVTDTELRDRVAAALPSYAEAATGAQVTGQQVQSIDSFFGIFRTVLLIFALIAIFVGSFIIVNTFNILIAQRTRELGLMRALGASRAQVFRSVLLEAFVTGLFASAVGVGVGVLMAHGLYSALSSLGSGLPKADLVLQFSTVIIGLLLGTLITVAASIFPARRATRIAPVAAIREAGDAAPPPRKARLISGGLLTVLGVGLVGVGLFGGGPNALQTLGFGAFLLFIGVSLLAFLTVIPIVRLLGIPVARLRGTPGKLARLNVMSAPRRSSSTAAALMIGATFVVGIAVLTDSIKASTRIAVQDAVKADYLVFGQSGGNGGGITPTTAAALAKDPHFSTVDDIRVGTILVNNTSTSAIALDPGKFQQSIAMDPAAGDPNSLGQPDTIFIDQQTAATNSWKVGDTVRVNFPQSGNTVSEHIGCIYNSNALLSGYLISTDTYAQQFTEQSAFVILLRAAPGVAHTEGLLALDHDLKSYPTLKAYDTAAFLELQSQQLDQVTTRIDLFLIMAIIIAAFGIMNTIALSIIERTREIGLLRAIGLSRRQTRTMIRWEAVLISFLGLVLGIILGVGLGVAVVRALGSTGIGHVSIPIFQLFVYAGVALIIGLLAAIFPGFRASRLNVLEAIATE